MFFGRACVGGVDPSPHALEGNWWNSNVINSKPEEGNVQTQWFGPGRATGFESDRDRDSKCHCNCYESGAYVRIATATDWPPGRLRLRLWSGYLVSCISKSPSSVYSEKFLSHAKRNTGSMCDEQLFCNW